MPSQKPRVFIAAPLFNQPQIAIISLVEDALSRTGFDYYSARRHSGGDKLTNEQRKRYDAWTPVYLSNERGLNSCRVQICVLEYALPDDDFLALHQREPGMLVQSGNRGSLELAYRKTRIELPDVGTVWEAGYMRAQGKLVVGFHSTKRAEHLNLMLSHGTDGLITGFDDLLRFLQGVSEPNNITVPERVYNRVMALSDNKPLGMQLLEDSQLFNWEACQTWDRRVE